MKLLGSTKNKITNNENGENVPLLEPTEAVLIHLILLTTIISKVQEICIYLLELLDISPKIFYILKAFL